MTEPDGERAKPKRARWYEQYIGECPVCGADKSYRVARYDEPPQKDKRHFQQSARSTYDWCDV